MRQRRKTLSATVVAGRYQLEREVARGGMGAVWLAVDQKLGRHVAVKVMAQELAQMSEALRRFEREALAVAGLRSAHIVEVYDYGVQEGLPYIVMELLVGENLGERLKRKTLIELGETNHIISQICKGLKAAHAAMLIHRDLKPSNIFIARRDDIEVVKLLDFGVVKTLHAEGGSEATHTGILLGTPQYMSPEQARATRNIDYRSDLWSVAVIAFRMLSGSNPFRGESVGDVVLKICSDALPRMSVLRPNLPLELDAFFERAFQRDPKDRFQTAVELADAFAAIAPQVPHARGRIPSHPQPAPQSNHTLEILQPLGAQTPAPLQSDGGRQKTEPMPIPEVAVIEQTPVSTTVGGTQLASKAPPAGRVLSGRALGVVVGTTAALIAAGLGVAIWMGSSETRAAPPAGADAQNAHKALEPPGEVSPPAPASETRDATATEDPQDLKAPAEEPSSDPSAKPASEKPKAARPLRPPPPPEPGPEPAPDPKKDRPDWGLGDDPL